MKSLLVVLLFALCASIVNGSILSLTLTDEEYAAEHERILAYWTKERMEAAVPIEELLGKDLTQRYLKPKFHNISFEMGGQEVVIPGKPPMIPSKLARIQQTAGRVFGTIDGGNFAASANVIPSGSGDLVITAAHAVFDISKGKYVDNWVFAPGYTSGNSPNGRWTFRRAVVLSQWSDNVPEVMNWDIGMALMGTLNGQHIESVVGSQGIAFNNQRGTFRNIFGYPCNIQNCQSLVTSSGNALEYPDPLYLGEGTPSSGMGGGASGGPTLASYNSGTGEGTQVSVLSFSISTVNNVLWGPYFGNDAQGLYNSVSN